MKNDMIVYKTTNRINGKIYIGKDEKARPNYFGSGKYYRRAEKKYGKINFIKTIIDFTDNRKDACLKEIFWINFYDARNPEVGYNIAEGGKGGDTLSTHPNIIEIKKKMSNNAKGKNNSMFDVHRFGTNAPMHGRNHSDKTKKKISIALSDGRMSGENNHFYGKHHSEETRKKMRDAKIGYVPWNKGKTTKEKTHDKGVDNNCEL